MLNIRTSILTLRRDACARIAQPADAMNGMDADWKMAAMAKHMAYSSRRPLTVADSVRAAHVINELRQAIVKYQDVKVAEADGYKMFAPQMKNQPQYHFTKGWNAIRNQRGFDPARPTSLLYKKECARRISAYRRDVHGIEGHIRGRSERAGTTERRALAPARQLVHPHAEPERALVRDERWTAGIRTAGCCHAGRVRCGGRTLHSAGVRVDAARERLSRATISIPSGMMTTWTNDHAMIGEPK